MGRSHPSLLCVCSSDGHRDVRRPFLLWSIGAMGTMIGYDDRGGYYWDDHEEETIVIDYFLYSDV
jgi:hypothetical protein